MANRRQWRPLVPAFDVWRDDAEIDMLRDDVASALGFRPELTLTLHDIESLGEADAWEPPPEPGSRHRAKLRNNRRNARHVRDRQAQQRKAS